MKHLLVKSETPIGKNIALSFVRCDTTSHIFSMIFISSNIVDKNHINILRGYIAPLYFHIELDGSWQPNFDDEVLSKLTANMSTKPTPIEIFDYIYGILHDPVYRERFNEFLKRDFPRVPIINAPNENDDDFIVTEDMFRAYVIAGERLRKLHLMQKKIPADIKIDPPTAADLEIGAIKYKDGILKINSNKRITGIPEDVWNYRIGGYQVLDKWFKSHKGKTMSIDDFDHIANVVGLLAETIKVQASLCEMHNNL